MGIAPFHFSYSEIKKNVRHDLLVESNRATARDEIFDSNSDLLANCGQLRHDILHSMRIFSKIRV